MDLCRSGSRATTLLSVLLVIYLIAGKQLEEGEGTKEHSYIWVRFKATVSRDFRLQESVSPKPLIIQVPLGPFRIFSKIRRDIRSVVETGGKIATGINNPAELVAKFAAGVVDTGGAP
jgi:hypothetical protein